MFLHNLPPLDLFESVSEDRRKVSLHVLRVPSIDPGGTTLEVHRDGGPFLR